MIPNRYDAGHRAALEDIARLAVAGKTRDEALRMIEEYLEARGIARDWIGA
jgi:predicted RNase H-like HicB family nuclease